MVSCNLCSPYRFWWGSQFFPIRNNVQVSQIATKLMQLCLIYERNHLCLFLGGNQNLLICVYYYLPFENEQFQSSMEETQGLLTMKFKRCGQNNYNNMKEYALPINTFLTVWHSKCWRERERGTERQTWGGQEDRNREEGQGKAPPPLFIFYFFSNSTICYHQVYNHRRIADSPPLKTIQLWRIHFASARNASVQPYSFFLMFCGISPQVNNSTHAAEIKHGTVSSSNQQCTAG